MLHSGIVYSSWQTANRKQYECGDTYTRKQLDKTNTAMSATTVIILYVIFKFDADASISMFKFKSTSSFTPSLALEENAF